MFMESLISQQKESIDNEEKEAEEKEKEEDSDEGVTGFPKDD